MSDDVGQPSALAKMRGKPQTIENAMRYVERQDSGCWLWTGAKTALGYGRLSANGRQWKAHRYVYTELVGPISTGLDLDHLCRVRNCVNPDHLEPVSHLENVRRGESSAAQKRRHAARTHCKHGHEFTPENTYTYLKAGRHISRACRECARRLRSKVRAA